MIYIIIALCILSIATTIILIQWISAKQYIRNNISVLAEKNNSIHQLEIDIERTNQDKQNAIASYNTEKGLRQKSEEELSARNNTIADNNRKIDSLNMQIQELNQINGKLVGQLDGMEQMKKNLTSLMEEKLKGAIGNIGNNIKDENVKKVGEFLNMQTESMQKHVKNMQEEITKNATESNSKLQRYFEKFHANVSTVESHYKDFSKATKNIVSIFRGQHSIKVGQMGEMILENMLQYFNFHKDKDYYKQKSYTDKNGKTLRPDFILVVGDRKIVIDSKASIEDIAKYNDIDIEHHAYHNQAYHNQVHNTQQDSVYNDNDDNINAIDNTIGITSKDNSSNQSKNNIDKQKKDIANTIKQKIRKHIDELHAKAYHMLDSSIKKNVIMFCPMDQITTIIENYHEDIIGYGYHKDIMVVTPSTLAIGIALFADVIRNDNFQKNTQQIHDVMRNIVDQVLAIIRDIKSMDKKFTDIAKINQEINKRVTSPRKGYIPSSLQELSSLGIKMDNKKIEAIQKDIVPLHDKVNNKVTDIPNALDDVI